MTPKIRNHFACVIHFQNKGIDTNSKKIDTRLNPISDYQQESGFYNPKKLSCWQFSTNHPAFP